MTIPPTVEDLGANDDDNELPGDPHGEEEDEIQFDDPDEEDDDDKDEEDDEDDDDEVQVVTRSRPRVSKSSASGVVPFNPEIHDITGYEKADIIKLQNMAYLSDAPFAKRVKGTLLGLPQRAWYFNKR